MGSKSYRNVYLRSEHWSNLRIAKLAKCNAECHFCKSKSTSNDVHHVYYPHSIYETKLEHLRVLCRSCHNLVHEVLKKWPAINKELESSSRWRITEQHVCRLQGRHFRGMQKTESVPNQSQNNHHSYCAKRIRTARDVVSHGTGKRITRADTPFTFELSKWLIENPNVSDFVIVVMAAVFGNTGFKIFNAPNNPTPAYRLQAIELSSVRRLRHVCSHGI